MNGRIIELEPFIIDVLFGAVTNSEIPFPMFPNGRIRLKYNLAGELFEKRRADERIGYGPGATGDQSFETRTE